MSVNRPDLHTPQHDQWDQGGYCNSLVTDDDGCGVVCGYRAPRETRTPTTQTVEDRYWLATVNEEGVRLRAGEGKARAEFRTWLAEHDAKVRAEALTDLEPGDLADLLQGISDGLEGLANRDALRRAAAVVRLLVPPERADRIEKEAGLK